MSTPTAGSPNSSEDPKIATAVSTLNGLLTSRNLIDPSQFAAGSVADAKLASPNNSVYKTLLAVGGVTNGSGSTTKYFGHGGETVLITTPTISTSALPHSIYFDDADFTVGSLTQKLRIRAQVHTRGTVDAITYTVGLYPLSSISGGTYTVGAVVSGSTVAFASPSINTLNQNNSGDFTVPSDGQYVLGVALSGSETVSQAVYAQLQTRNV